MALRLTAASDQKLMYTGGAPDYNSPYTFLCAFRPATVAASQTILAIRNSITNYDRLFIDSTQSFKLRFRSVGANVSLGSSISATIPVAATWYYLAMVRHSATSFEFFGGTTPTGMASITATGAPITQTTCAGRTAASAVEIGGLVSSTEEADGRFRYARLFTSALTLAQIRLAAGSGLWAEWLLADGTTLTDTGGSSRTMVATNGPATTEADDAVTWPEATNNRRGVVSFIEFQMPDIVPPQVEPVANFTYTVSTQDSQNVQFTDTSTDSDGTISEWAWDFGDGTFAFTQHPNKIYDMPGTYTVTLTVTDDDTLQDSAVTLVSVGARGPWTSAFGCSRAGASRMDLENNWVENISPPQEDEDS